MRMLAVPVAWHWLQVPPVRQRVMTGVEQAASIHAGHVFTVGHAYKLLDETAYITPRQVGLITLSDAEAARFVVRAIASRSESQPVRLVFEGRSPSYLEPGDAATAASELLEAISRLVGQDEQSEAVAEVA